MEKEESISKNLNIERIKNFLSEHKEELKEKYKVSEIGIFGSYVREEQKKSSDVDILVEFFSDARLSLLDFIEVENYISDLLKVKVDLVEKSALKPRIARYVLNEVVQLWKE